MHTLPRLSTTRPYPRCCSLLHNTLPPLSHICSRASRSRTSQSIPQSWQAQVRNGDTWRKLCRYRRREAEVPVNLENRRLDSRSQHHPLSCYHECCGLLLYPPPFDRHIERSPRYNCLAQDCLVRIHQPRSATCIPPSLETGRRCPARDILAMSISAEYNSGEPLLFLVGTYSRLPTSLPSDSQNSLAVCRKTNG